MSFLALPLTDGLLHTHDGVYASTLRGFCGPRARLPAGATHYGFVLGGSATLHSAERSHRLYPGMYFCVCDAARIEGEARGIVMSRLGYAGVFLLGGPIEQRGRLRYIDGCTDSLLLSPPLLGDPCLNHLHIPPRTAQTRHTHPSVRIGVIVAGHGRCETPTGTHRLLAGLVFVIEPDTAHSFFTDDAALDVVVYHPDSDTGPTHEDHPMRNRTLIDGQPARGAR